MVVSADGHPAQQFHIETQVVHAGEAKPRYGGAAVLPIFQSATFAYEGELTYASVKYARCSNTPNHTVLAAKIAALENTEDGLVTTSGMAAISTTLLTFLRPGDHMLTQTALYGGTYDFVHKDLADLGVSVTEVDIAQPATWQAALQSNTKVFYVETISNPLTSVGDLPAVASFAKQHGLVSMIDNTFASPVIFRPADWGFDIVLHSATKYLNGHSDLIAGAIAASADSITKIVAKLNHFGGSLDAHACFLLHRGLRTLVLRVRQQSQTAQALAEFLEQHPQVAQVHYPGLPSHPAHKYAKRLFEEERCGGVLAFELKGGVEAVDTMFEALKLPFVAPSLGGVESLITRPSSTTHVGMSAEERQAAGISDGLVRLSVGIENTQDLTHDFEQALSRIL
ncbi:hypothetical protein WJX72_008033 [[Myrmecia] bisecta]|uniref:plant cystathionine gamma-synthase n=1 Tax=[Myrmecia] bisecta TaxID=41462 RepID=A0AAW1P6W7_9CHLO